MTILPARFNHEIRFASRVMNRLQQRGWLLSEIAEVWNYHRLYVHHLLTIYRTECKL